MRKQPTDGWTHDPPDLFNLAPAAYRLWLVLVHGGFVPNGSSRQATGPLRVHMVRIRKALRDLGSPYQVHNVRGVGYQLRRVPEQNGTP